MSAYDNFDPHFRFFGESLNKAIGRLGKRDTKEFLAHQKMQVETLVKTETKLRKVLINGKFGNTVYKKFIKYIREDKRNLLFARPFFRERQKIFTSKVSKALRNRDHKALQKFHFNYQFIQFLVTSRKWKDTSPVMVLVKEIERLRNELVILNMPLAISRARIFYSRTPPSQLSYMDLVQIASEGLLSAIDKFVLPFSKVFRSVAIGRIVGNSISAYSETLIHFYPTAKRVLYRANKSIGRMGSDPDMKELAARVNDGLPKRQKATPDQISDLMAAASCVSADSIVSTDPNLAESISRFSAPDSCRPDVIVEANDSSAVLAAAMAKLSILERKVLILKGIS